MQMKAITWELYKREKEGQSGTSQAPKQTNNPPKKQVIKLGKGKNKVIVHSGSDEETTIVATSKMADQDFQDGIHPKR